MINPPVAPQQEPQQDGIRLRRTDGGDLSWEDIASGEIRLTATFYRPWSVLNDENKLRLLNALSARGSIGMPQEPDVDVQLLAWAVTNCHTLARRRIRAGVDLEYWEHVQRICEKAGARSKGVLRASLPTEITEGSGERDHRTWFAGNEQAWADLAAEGGLPALSASRIDPPVPSGICSAHQTPEPTCRICYPPVPSPGGDTARVQLDRFDITDLGVVMPDPQGAYVLYEQLAAVSSSSVADPWLPIETHDGSPMPVLVADRGDVVEAYFSAEHDVWWEINSCDDGSPGSDRRVNPSHWMPLPNPPSASSASAEADSQKKNTTI